MENITQIEARALAGVPSEQLKAAVLNAVYNLEGIKLISGFQFLAAKYLTNDVGIFVVAGNFGREHFKQAIAEAKAAGLNSRRVYVYGQTGTYFGNAICFTKFEEIGINMEQASAATELKAEEKPPATKLVEVRLSALTRVEYTEVVEVPANITQDELNALVNDRYRQVDGGEYASDPEFWERGTCYAVDSEMPNATPSMMAFRTEHGLHVERADADACVMRTDDRDLSQQSADFNTAISKSKDQ